MTNGQSTARFDGEIHQFRLTLAHPSFYFLNLVWPEFSSAVLVSVIVASGWDRLRRSALQGIVFALDHEALASVIEKRQADCDSGGGHVLAIIKPKIVRHTIILSANYPFLLTPPTSPSDRLANPGVINLSIRGSRSLHSTFQVIFFFGVEHVRCSLL